MCNQCPPPYTFVLEEIFHWFKCEVYCFGVSRLSPCGAKVLRVWVQFLSTRWRMIAACGLLGGILMNSRMLILTSSMPWWSFCEKCLGIGLVWSPLVIPPKWSTNLSFSLSRVCPTYCIPHLLHVAAYTMLELLQETFFMVVWLFPVVLLISLPVLFKSLQYLQLVFLQYE